MPSFEEAIIAGVVAEFFNDSRPTQMDGNGNTYFQQGQASSLAARLFKEHEQAIYDAVSKKFDLDALAEQIAKLVLRRENDNWGSWGGRYSGKDFQKELRAKVIEKVADAQAANVMSAFQIKEGQ